MTGYFDVRTDLALEAKENLDKAKEELKGIRIEEERNEKWEIYTTKVTVETENSARAIGKPAGCYITMEVPEMTEEDAGYHREISVSLAETIKTMRKKTGGSVLVVGLGNRNITPDALGPLVVDHLRITRHLEKEFKITEKEKVIVSAIVPGVMAQTGMETLEIIKGVVSQIKPDTVIVIDALAARSIRRLNRTIQLSDTGIHPGAGVGNHRCKINDETLGIPVLAIGVPTVVDAATIVYDALEQAELKKEKMQLMGEQMSPGLRTMFVTPKDIDESINRISYTISEGLNLAFAGEE